MSGYIEYIRGLIGKKPVIMVSVAVLVIDGQNRCLLIRNKWGSKESEIWAVPGGFMEMGETTEETARREIKEETGLEIGRLKLVTVLSQKEVGTLPNGDQLYPVTIVYSSKDIIGGELKPDNSEVCEAKFFPFTDLPKMNPDIKRQLELFANLAEKWGDF